MSSQNTNKQAPNRTITVEEKKQFLFIYSYPLLNRGAMAKAKGAEVLVKHDFLLSPRKPLGSFNYLVKYMLHTD